MIMSSKAMILNAFEGISNNLHLLFTDNSLNSFIKEVKANINSEKNN